MWVEEFPPLGAWRTSAWLAPNLAPGCSEEARPWEDTAQQPGGRLRGNLNKPPLRPNAKSVLLFSASSRFRDPINLGRREENCMEKLEVGREYAGFHPACVP